MKIYISGKITGLSETEFMTNFARAEMWLEKRGNTVINPAKTNSTLPADTTYEEYMKMSFLMLSFCDAIYMLSNFSDSKGARAELAKAKENGLKIIYESEV